VLNYRATLINELPRSVVALVWALAALHWRSGGKYAGATHKGLRVLLGTNDRVALQRLVRKARECNAVVVLRVANARNRNQPHIMLTHATLTRLEQLWRT